MPHQGCYPLALGNAGGRDVSCLAADLSNEPVNRLLAQFFQVGYRTESQAALCQTTKLNPVPYGKR
jgi:hypothetical protein